MSDFKSEEILSLTNVTNVAADENILFQRMRQRLLFQSEGNTLIQLFF